MEEQDNDKDFLQSPWVTRLIVVFTALFAFGAGMLLYYNSQSYALSKFADPDPKLRRWAVDNMVKKGESAGDLMQRVAMDNKRDPETRRLAVYVLGEVRYKPALTDLRKLFRNGEGALRGQAAFALGRFRDESMLDELIVSYPEAPKGVKLKIIMALGEIGGRESVDFLRGLEDADDEIFTQSSRLALEKIREGK